MRLDQGSNPRLGSRLCRHPRQIPRRIFEGPPASLEISQYSQVRLPHQVLDGEVGNRPEHPGLDKEHYE